MTGELYRMFARSGNQKEMDRMTKTAIVYYSMGGTNYQLAKWAEEAVKEMGGEVRLLKMPETAPQEVIDSNEGWKANIEATKDVPEVTPEDLVWADSIIFSVPTRFGNIASQAQSFIDTLGGVWAQGQLANKAVSAMSSAQNVHGGQEATILSLYTSMYHWGAIVAAPGYTDEIQFAAGGNPYGVSVTSRKGKIVEDEEVIQQAVAYQAQRTVNVGKALKNL